MKRPFVSSAALPVGDDDDSDIARLTTGTRRLTSKYVLALSTVAMLSVAGQLLVQHAIERQRGDSTVVNIAGRQRMLSQRIVKAVLVIDASDDDETRRAAQTELQESLASWRTAHAGLQQGDQALGLPGSNSPTVERMFRGLQDSFDQMNAAVAVSLAASRAESPHRRLLSAEREFLEGMDRIVFQYDREARAHVDRLKYMERMLLALTLVVLAAEGWYVFRPAVTSLNDFAVRLQKASHEMVDARKAAEAANEAKTRFLANMSHELRTPLHAILAAADLACRARLRPESTEHLATIDDAGRSLLALVNDLLDLSRIEAGGMELRLEPARPRSLVTRIKAMLACEARRKSLHFDCQVAENVPESIVIDELRVRQVILNLLANAIKFTCEGNVQLRVEWCDSEPLAPLRISVNDTGPGIPAHERTRIFEPFTQVDGSERRRHGGAGLGLSIVARLVELMGGRVRVDSELGRGTCFDVSLPADVTHESGGLSAIDHGTRSPSAAPRDNELGCLNGLRVLAAEDVSQVRALMEQQLTACGCVATLVEDGQEALERFAADHFDVVLLDLHMPRLSGLEVARQLRLRETAAGARRIAILGLSADGQPTTRADCMSAGMDDLVVKPFDVARLEQAIRRCRDARERVAASVDPLALEGLLRRCGGRAELAQELVAMLLAALASAPRDLRAAVAMGNVRETFRLAHRLRGQILLVDEHHSSVWRLVDVERAASQSDAGVLADRVASAIPALQDLAERIKGLGMCVAVGP